VRITPPIGLFSSKRRTKDSFTTATRGEVLVPAAVPPRPLQAADVHRLEAAVAHHRNRDGMARRCRARACGRTFLVGRLNRTLPLTEPTGPA
jgi:hypothetical protein